jgi:hypothetical protein
MTKSLPGTGEWTKWTEWTGRRLALRRVGRPAYFRRRGKAPDAPPSKALWQGAAWCSRTLSRGGRGCCGWSSADTAALRRGGRELSGRLPVSPGIVRAVRSLPSAFVRLCSLTGEKICREEGRMSGEPRINGSRIGRVAQNQKQKGRSLSIRHCNQKPDKTGVRPLLRVADPARRGFGQHAQSDA